MTIKYLQGRKYYEDLYDRHTVEICLSFEKSLAGKTNVETIKTNRSTIKVSSNIAGFMLSVMKGDRYFKRDRVIQEWIERDRERDRIFEESTAPKTFGCVLCKKEMEVLDKSLVYFEVKTPHVKWMLGCRGCGSISHLEKGIRRNEFPWQCPKCKRRMKSETEHKGRKYITKESCECGYKNVDTLDLGKYDRTRPAAAPSLEGEQRFQEDKLRFCLSPEEGRNYVNFEKLSETVNNILGKKNEQAVETPKLEVLALPKLKKRVQEKLISHGYAVASFGKPKLDDQVSLSITLTDERERTPHTSKKDLSKVLTEILEGTNWCLVKTSVEEKLGVLSVRVRSFTQRTPFKL